MTRKVIQSFGLEHRCTAIFSTGAKMLREMPDQEAEICILCEQARVIEQKRHIAFRQRTDKGDVSSSRRPVQRLPTMWFRVLGRPC
jgi:hypothetical protein